MPSERKPSPKPALGLMPKASRFELRRSALLEAFTVLGDARIVALVAPSGFGKTTTLAQALRESEAQSVWCELPAVETGLVELARALLNILVVDSVSDSPASDHPDQLLRTLVLTLETFTDGLLLVLEGADHLNAEAGAWLLKFAASLQDGQHVILTGYELGAIPLARLVAEGRAQLFTANDLAFSREETITYLRTRGFEDDPITTFEALEGWPLGISLVAGGASPGLSPTDLIADTLARLPEPLRSRLPAAAVCETWSEEFATRLNCDLPAGWLAQARRAGLPLSPLGRHTYKPAKVLIAALEAELRRTPLQHSSLHVAAGGDAQLHGRHQPAIQHYLLAHREDLALKLLQPLAAKLFERAEFQSIVDLLDALLVSLPSDLRELLGGALIEIGEHARGEVLLRQLRSKKQLSREGLWMLGKLALREGQFERILEIVDEGLLGISRDQIEAARFLYLRGFAFLNLGKPQETVQLGFEILQLAEKHDDLHHIGQAMNLIQLGQMHLRNWTEAEFWCKRGIEFFNALGSHTLTLGFHNDLAFIKMFQDHTADAMAILEPLLNNAEYTTNEAYATLMETLADVLLWDGAYSMAANQYHKATEKAQQVRQFPEWRYRLKLVEACWRNGEHARALSELATVVQLTPKHLKEAPHFNERKAFVEGLIAFEQNQLETATNKWQQALKQTDDPTHPPRALAFLAEIARREQRLEYSHLERLIVSLDAMPSDAVLKTDQLHLKELWHEAQARGWFLERLAGFSTQSILEPSMPENPASASNRIVLEVITLGSLQVRLAGKSVKLPFAKAGELLVWLALHGPSTLEQVIDALWYGSGETRHHEYFRVAVRRLRTALSTALPESLTEHQAMNPLPYARGLYALSDRLEVRLDTNLAKQALEGTVPMSQALEAYHAEFLPGVDSEWVTDVRTQCLESTVTLALTLAAQHETNEPQVALGTYRRAIELEPLNELGHLGLIRTHLTLGGLPAASQAYTAYARMLLEEFGLEPSNGLRDQLNALGLRV
jgi:LuxR family transcriptional regulator, maltose regulon positive regulatory protein